MPATPETAAAPGVVLAFDFGSKRIGVAVGDTLTRRPRPLTTLDNTSRTRWDAIAGLIAEWSPNALVVGVPLTLDGQRQPMTDAAERFCRRLSGRYHLPVYPAEERMTSMAADTTPLPGHSRDAVAAAHILAGWLGPDADIAW